MITDLLACRDGRALRCLAHMMCTASQLDAHGCRRRTAAQERNLVLRRTGKVLLNFQVRKHANVLGQMTTFWKDPAPTPRFLPPPFTARQC